MAQSSILERYIRRLGLSPEQLRERASGMPEQILDLLEELLPAHVEAVCFENLDIVAGQARGELDRVSVERDEVSRKLLDDERGGYCHEHSVLMRGVLDDLGLKTFPLLARVLTGDRRAAPGGLTHQASIMSVAGRSFLVDPGFGGGTPETPLELVASAEVRSTSRGQYRLVPSASVLAANMRAESDWVLQSRVSGDQKFRNLYSFSEEPRESADLEVSNWYTSTNPNSPFTGPPFMTRSRPGAGRVSLVGRQLRRTRYGAEAEHAEAEHEEIEISSRTELAAVLANDFGISAGVELTALVWESLDEAQDN